MLVFDDVSLSLKGNSILKNLSFSVKPGEMLAIVGESGAGKSSVFKLLTAEYTPTRGEVALDQISLWDISFSGIQKYRKQIGVIFQDFRLLPKKTVFQNVAFALEVCGDTENLRKKTETLIDLVGLSEKSDSFPEELSGGEAQRVSIARALVHDPKILIADEPTGNLDPRNSLEIAQLFQRINRDKGITILFSTHDPMLVHELSPRVLYLKNGQLALDGKDYHLDDIFLGKNS